MTDAPIDGQNPVPENDWRATLPEDWTAPGRDAAGQEAEIPLRVHPALAKYASKDEAIKALVHAQRLLGKKAEQAREGGSLLSMEEPGRGCPECPEAYALPDIELPEEFSIDEALRLDFLRKAHELGLSDAQAGGLYAWFVPLNVEAALLRQSDARSERQRIRDRELALLRQVHGGAASAVLESARRAVLALGGSELMRRLEDCGAADDARVVQAFARVAPMVSESALKGRDGMAVQGVTAQRLREMMRDPRYFDPSRRDEAFVRQVREGFDALYPGEQETAAQA
jgi:hypothetical protein